MKRRFLLTIEYDGTNYSGFQKQKEDITIQQTIEDAIFKIHGQKVDLISSGRTDKGTHAIAHMAHIDFETDLNVGKLRNAINFHLPKDIYIKKVKVVPFSFDARKDAKSKTYVYRIVNQWRSPINDRYAFLVGEKLNMTKMRQAAKYLEGEHDFKGFACKDMNVKTTVRTLNRVSIKKSGTVIEISVNGSGFLYNMVRIIAGTLLYVGLGKFEPEVVKTILQKCDRELAGPTLPSAGLFLKEVIY